MMRIPLSKGYSTIVDSEMYPILIKRKWHAKVKPSGMVYAAGKCGTKNIKMHRIILGVTDPSIQVDHIDGDGLNNTKANLRICTNSQNQMNKKAGSHSKSGIRGVYPLNGGNRWRVEIIKENKVVFQKECNNLLDAIRYRNDAVLKYHGEFARMEELVSSFTEVTETSDLPIRSPQPVPSSCG